MPNHQTYRCICSTSAEAPSLYGEMAVWLFWAVKTAELIDIGEEQREPAPVEGSVGNYCS